MIKISVAMFVVLGIIAWCQASKEESKPVTQFKSLTKWEQYAKWRSDSKWSSKTNSKKS